jgi:hypothetical protein
METFFQKIARNLNWLGITRFFVRKTFPFFERYLRIHITPVDYFSPIPDVSALDPRIFEKIFDDTGLRWNVDGQLAFLDEKVSKYLGEYVPQPNDGLSQADAFILYAMIREKKPRVMIEVGSGESTKISLMALEKNREEGIECSFHAIEPYPRDHLRKIAVPWFTLVEKKLEYVEIDFLVQADLLFIDSSHVAKIGSDVICEMLEIVPKLKMGAVIHWHDIMLPMNYWKDWTHTGTQFWNESYMLHAFLLFNETYQIVWASRYMHLNHASNIVASIPSFQPEKHRITSFWLQRVK